jgi:hypothetical protein
MTWTTATEFNIFFVALRLRADEINYIIIYLSKHQRTE